LSSFLPSFFGVPSFLFCTSIKEGRKELLTSSSFFGFGRNQKYFSVKRLARLFQFSAVHTKNSSPACVGRKGEWWAAHRVFVCACQCKKWVYLVNCLLILSHRTVFQLSLPFDCLCGSELRNFSKYFY
jgi:hypothetical protein